MGMKSNIMTANTYGVAGMGAVNNGASAATPTATGTGGTPQMDITTQSPTATFIGIIVLLVAIRVAYELAGTK